MRSSLSICTSIVRHIVCALVWRVRGFEKTQFAFTFAPLWCELYWALLKDKHVCTICLNRVDNCVNNISQALNNRGSTALFSTIWALGIRLGTSWIWNRIIETRYLVVRKSSASLNSPRAHIVDRMILPLPARVLHIKKALLLTNSSMVITSAVPLLFPLLGAPYHYKHTIHTRFFQLLLAPQFSYYCPRYWIYSSAPIS